MQKKYAMHPTTFVIMAKKSARGQKVPFKVLWGGTEIQHANDVILNDWIEPSHETYKDPPNDKFVTYGPEDYDWLEYFGLLRTVPEKVGPIFCDDINVTPIILAGLNGQMVTVFDPKRMPRKKANKECWQ